jgi:hypothetical protein
LALVSFAIGPIGVPPEARGAVTSALLWIILFFSAATGLPRAYVREEETGTALALRRVASAPIVLAGKTLFNFALFLAIAVVAVPAFSVCRRVSGRRDASPGGLRRRRVVRGLLARARGVGGLSLMELLGFDSPRPRVPASPCQVRTRGGGDAATRGQTR